MAPPRTRLYLITPPEIDPAAFSRELDAALAAGDVACVQLRLKGASDDAVRAAAKILMPVAHEHGAAFLINDRPDLARELDADGVHVGQDDATLADARALLGKDRIVGVTCHASRDLAFDAAEAGADYVAFGAFFPSATKPDPKGRADLDLLEGWTSHVTVPCVAIGGITPANCGPLVAAKADFLAVSGAVWNCPEGPAAAVKAFEQAILARPPG